MLKTKSFVFAKKLDVDVELAMHLALEALSYYCMRL